MNRFTRIAVCFAGAILWGAGLQQARADDYAFFHENVMGTSLELRVRAEDEAAARWAEDLRAPPDRSPEHDLQRL